MHKLILTVTISASLFLAACGSDTTDTVQDIVDNAVVNVSGTINNLSNQPLAGYTVSANYASGSLPAVSSVTDTNGHYSVSVLKNSSIYLTVNPAGSTNLSKFITVNSAYKSISADDANNSVELPTTAEAESMLSTAFGTTKTMTDAAWLVVTTDDINGNRVGSLMINIDKTPSLNPVYTACDGSSNGGSATTTCASNSNPGPAYLAAFSGAQEVTVTVNGASQTGMLKNGEALFMDFEQ